MKLWASDVCFELSGAVLFLVPSASAVIIIIWRGRATSSLDVPKVAYCHLLFNQIGDLG